LEAFGIFKLVNQYKIAIEFLLYIQNIVWNMGKFSHLIVMGWLIMRKVFNYFMNYWISNLTWAFCAIICQSPRPQATGCCLSAPGVWVTSSSALVLASLTMDRVSHRNGPGGVPPGSSPVQEVFRRAKRPQSCNLKHIFYVSEEK
jgi:hypothetical protein